MKPIIETLKEASEVRIREDKDFQYILDDIERYKEVKKRKTVSLREQDRIDEKEEEKVRNKSRQRERQARRFPGLKIHRITMDDVRNESPAVLLFDGDDPESYPEVVEDEENDTEDSLDEADEIDEESYVGEDEEEQDKRLDAYTREGLHILRHLIDAGGMASQKASAEALSSNLAN